MRMAERAPTETQLTGFLTALARPTPATDLVTPAVRLGGLAEVREGLVVGCGREIAIEGDGTADVRTPPSHRVVATEPHTDRAPRITTQSDEIGLPSHGVTVTHLDARAHFAVDGRTHGGHPVAPHTAADPPAPGRIHELCDGIVTRGVLLDVAALLGRPWLEAGEGIGPAELEAAEHAAGARIAEGDALLLRTGWPARRAALGPVEPWKHRPGLHAAALPWLGERGVAVVASDAAHDVVPSRYRTIPMPIHTVGLAAMGLALVDACDFERLAAACRERGRWTCLFIVAPLVFRNATGSPVNPLALL
jgi:kynurenine formamidase